jgi:hypothetical protein
MGSEDDDANALKQRAERLRQHARDARTLAKALGPYLDGVVKQATPRAADPAHPGNAIWAGPYADQCTTLLTRRQGTLRSMADSLVVDAGRWETAASHLDDQAKAAGKKAKTTAGGH